MVTTFEQLYTPEILRLAAEIPDCPLVTDAAYRVRVSSPICGSDLILTLDFDGDGRVTRYGHKLMACAFGQASVSLFARSILGALPHEVTQAGDALALMLAGVNDGATAGDKALPDRQLRDGSTPHGPLPEGLWTGFEALRPVIAYGPRHGAVMLPFKAYRQALTSP